MTKFDQTEPDFMFEDQFNGLVCGIDEAGRAPLAGPVTAGCVFISDEARGLPFIEALKDSKRIAKKKRGLLYGEIKSHLQFGIGHVWQEEIDEINIHHASLLAMKRAFDAMLVSQPLEIQMALIDGKFSPELSCDTQTLIKGDNRSKSIAAASILAKVERDRLMTELHEEYPHYKWNKNSGYPTKEHLQAIEIHGITSHHRQSFSPIKHYAQPV